MNKRGFYFLLPLVIGLVGTVHSGPINFLSATIPASGPTVSVTIKDGSAIRITNFVQDVASCQQVGNNTNCFVGEVKVIGGTNTAATVVLQATLVSAGETHKDFIIAGPATIAVDPIPNATLFISYNVENK